MKPGQTTSGRRWNWRAFRPSPWTRLTTPQRAKWESGYERHWLPAVDFPSRTRANLALYCSFLATVFFFLDSFFFAIAVSFPGSPCAKKRILLFLPEVVEMRYLHGRAKFTLILQNPQPAYQEISILF
jgi:hypothetical protein